MRKASLATSCVSVGAGLLLAFTAGCSAPTAEASDSSHAAQTVAVADVRIPNFVKVSDALYRGKPRENGLVGLRVSGARSSPLRRAARVAGRAESSIRSCAGSMFHLCSFAARSQSC